MDVVHGIPNKVVKIGVEALGAEGTPVTAANEFPSLGLEFKQAINMRKRRPSGRKYTTLIIPGKEHTEVDLDGEMVYDELPFQLASVVNYQAATGAGAAKTQQFRPNLAARDNSRSLTAEWGDPSAGIISGFRAAGLFLTEWGYELDREMISITGAGLGRRADPISAFSASTMLPQVPVLPEYVRVYSAGNMTDLAVPANRTKLLSLFKMTFGIGNRFNPFWPVDADLTSFGGRTEDYPEVGASFTVASHTSAGDFAGTSPFRLAKERAGSTIWIRVAATGPLIETGPDVFYSFVHDMALKVSDPWEHTDVDGSLLAVTWPCEVVDDEVAGYPYEMVTISKTAFT